MRIDVLTLFPEMFAPLDASMIKRAREAGLVDIAVSNIRDWATDKHHITDDVLYGGGAGMVMKPEPIFAAVEALRRSPAARVVVTAPAGKPFNQKIAADLARSEQVIIICGHYEGVDQRVLDHLATDIISLGDFVLTGGEIPALAIVDSLCRLIPGVLGDERAAEEESFSDGMLEYPHYTRPVDFRGWIVPEILRGGDHSRIARWRRERSLETTRRFRPELLAEAALDQEDAAFLGQLRREEEKPFSLSVALVHWPVYDKKKRVINTSLTNLDLHDIARAARTYGLDGYYLVQPIASQRQLMEDLLEHWQSGFGSTYNPDRKQALDLVEVVPQLCDAVERVEAATGSRPRLIATGAGRREGITSFTALRRIMEREGGSWLLLLGTGWGLTQEMMDEADFRLQPIWGRAGYNHLSVRSAAAIILDRLLGEQR